MSLVKKLQPSDLVALTEFARSVKTSVFMNWSENQILSSLDDYEVWAVFDQKLLQAALCVRAVDQDFEILWIQTQPDFLRQGLAKRLLSHWLDFASQHGRSVFLEVHQQNVQAIGLYQKLGFEKLGLRKNYYSDGAGAISFQLDLKKHKRLP